MNLIEFRHNKFYDKSIVNMLLLGICWICGIFIWQYLLLYAFDFNIYNFEGVAPYWTEHPKLALAFVIFPPLLWMILSVFPVNKFVRLLMEGRGKIEIFNNYAILYYGKKQLHIDSKTKIIYKKIPLKNIFSPIIYEYRIHQSGKLYRIVDSFRELYHASSLVEKYKGIRVSSSLFDALKEISFLTLVYVAETMVHTGGNLLYIRNVAIIIGESFPNIFDSSPYYVEYNYPIYEKDVPIITCLVRERENPIHVVGDIAFPHEPEHNTKITEAYLRALPIIDGIPLDEEVELDE